MFVLLSGSNECRCRCYTHCPSCKWCKCRCGCYALVSHVGASAGITPVLVWVDCPRVVCRCRCCAHSCDGHCHGCCHHHTCQWCWCRWTCCHCHHCWLPSSCWHVHVAIIVVQVAMAVSMLVVGSSGGVGAMLAMSTLVVTVIIIEVVMETLNCWFHKRCRLCHWNHQSTPK